MSTLPSLDGDDITSGQELTLKTRSGETLSGEVTEITLVKDATPAVEGDDNAVYQFDLDVSDDPHRVTFHPGKTVLLVELSYKNGNELVGNMRQVQSIDL